MVDKLNPIHIHTIECPECHASFPTEDSFEKHLGLPKWLVPNAFVVAEGMNTHEAVVMKVGKCKNAAVEVGFIRGGKFVTYFPKAAKLRKMTAEDKKVVVGRHPEGSLKNMLRYIRTAEFKLKMYKTLYNHVKKTHEDAKFAACG